MLYLTDETLQSEAQLSLDEIARQGAIQMLRQALEIEIQTYMEQNQSRDKNGHQQVVRNGYGKSRKITMGCGTVELQAPRIHDKRVAEDGSRRRFRSSILPPYMRRSPKVAEVLPVLYLRGLSSNDFQPALKSLLGEEASGLSPAQISRLTSLWESEYEVFKKRDLSASNYVYIWVDGIHFNVRLEEDRLCTLVMLGVCDDGRKELIAIEDGYRESKESWLSVLRDLKERGMKSPMVAVGDGALGFWQAACAIWPKMRHQRDWCHKIVNVLDKLPKRLHGKAKGLLKEMMYACKRSDSDTEMKKFKAEFEAKYPKAVECLLKDKKELQTLFDFPALHWRHLRTSNPIESAFATLRLRQRITKGSGSRSKALVMAYKLLDMAQLRWLKISGAHLLPKVREGIVFKDGEMEQNIHQEMEQKFTEDAA
jgi:transposase-like protein